MVTPLAKSYASALFNYQVGEPTLTTIYGDFINLERWIRQVPLLRSTLASPLVCRLRVYQALLGYLKPHVCAITFNFLQLVAQKRRLAALNEIVQAFLAEYAAYQQLQKAHLTTAAPLTAALRASFLTLIKRLTGAKKIDLEIRVEPLLIGGYQLRVGNRLLDSSLRMRLELLHQQWSAPQMLP